jgi:4-diphosphocytidyl-2-C-methyl-D-erythritol kinase
MSASPPRALYDLPAPAKLNAFLHVVGKRADGYHLLQSAFVLIDWADTLHVERRDDGLLRRHDLAAVLPEDDLCLRAARALQQASGTGLGADIHIKKQVPWGAGLGGGSSDAATTLLALNRLWGLGWTKSQLLPLALSLGADVPFFVAGHNAFVQGVGEQLTPINWPRAAYVVVKPRGGLPTREVFAHPALEVRPDTAILAGSFAFDHRGHEEEQVDAWVKGWGANHLQAAASQCCPAVAMAADWLQVRHGNSRMTGSGNAVFARLQVDEVATGKPLATNTDGDLPEGWASRLCHSLSRHPLVDWAG